MRQFKLTACFVALFALGSSQLALSAKPEGVGKGKGKFKDQQESVEDAQGSQGEDRRLLRALSAAEKDELANEILDKQYGFSKNSTPVAGGLGGELPPGLKKKLERGGSLPPGWQKKLQRGEVIDRDTYRQAERMPDELLRRITGRDDAVELLRVGDQILRVAEGRGTILDVIDLSDRALRMLEGN